MASIKTNKKYYDENGVLHREDGPAVEWCNSHKIYYLTGKEYSYEEWIRIRKMLWLS